MAIGIIVWLAVIGLNLAAFASFGLDKARARRGARRLSERDLLALATLGGTGGAYLGRWYFRHKTKKASFSVALHLIALAQGAILLWLVTCP
jgi:uncharacterized membrane protein YsdA (DUF1294 family)